MSSQGTKPQPGQMKKVRNIPTNINTPKMQRFIELYALHPCTYARFAELIGVSKSRVGQILRQEHVKKAVEEKRQEFFDNAVVAFKGLAGKSVDVLRDKLDDDTDSRDLRAAIEVLKGLGIAVPKMDLGDMKVELHFPKSKKGKPENWLNGSD